MSDKNKNIRDHFTDFFRYHRNELSGEERNSLEREFQKDPFTEEAAEGYRFVSQHDTLKDLNELNNRVKKRTTVRSGYIVYRIAASIAVLIAISAIFFFLHNGKQTAQLAENSVQSLKPVIAKNLPAAEPGIKETISNQLTRKVEKKTVSTEVEKTLAEHRKRTTIISEQNLSENRKNDSIPPISISPEEAFVADNRLSAPVRAISHDSTGKTLVEDYSGMKSKKIQAKSDIPEEVKFDPSVASLSEVVVVGYGAGNEDEESKDADAVHILPQPSTGKSKFNKYIQNNLHQPDSLTAGQRVVVVLDFLVKTDGSIDSIRIVRSPGKQFSDEAIRVLKSGPSWKPARENGLDIEEVIRLRIVFR
jgi:outer membrane biosynthesis protein TonB